MTRDTIFRVASLTKPIVAAATIALVDDAKLNLDEPVDRLLPELADRRVLRRFDGPIDETVPASHQITVRDLLTCRMGFGIIWGAPDAHPIQRAAEKLHLGAFGPPHPQAPPPPDEWIRRFSTLPLMYQPGERWAYNTAFEVLGVLVVRASGRSLGALLEERIFLPLGMKDTGFSVPPGHLDRLPTSYAANPATDSLEPYDGVRDSAWSKPPAFPSAAGGLVSTVDDLLAFGHMMLARGEHGAAVGGVTGALVGLGIPELDPKTYEGKIRGGNILIAVHTTDADHEKRAEQTLEKHRAHDVVVASDSSVPKAAHTASP